MSWKRVIPAFAMVAWIAGTACAEDGRTGMDVGPINRALSSDDPTCKVDADCATGETCTNGTCQIQRCANQKFESAPPLKARSYFAVDRELAVLDDGRNVVDAFEPTDGSFSRSGSLSLAFGAEKVVDTAGGNFSGNRPEGLAVAIAGRSTVSVITGRTRVEMPVGFVPIAVAAGDVDGDGTDEVAALAATGEVAVCVVAKKTCTKRRVDDITAKDLAMGDVDGDGRDEPVVLGDRRGGNSHVFVMNFDEAGTGQSAIEDLDTGHVAERIATGELDRVPPAEIVTLEDGGYLGFASDSVRLFGRKGGKLQELGTSTIAKDAVDLHVGDLDGDDKAEIVVLEKSGVEVFDVTSPSAIQSAYKTPLSSTTSPARIAMSDLDGDSPSGSLVGEKQLVPGPVVPVALLVYPPYSRQRSSGTASVVFGNTESNSESAETTVALSASLSLGFEVGFPLGAKGRFGASVDRSIALSKGISRSVSIGERFSVDARPELEGPDNGVVVLSNACFHAYTYTVDDPFGKLGEKINGDKKMSIFVPVGGQTSLWSLKRYNVLAERLGNLPKMAIPYKVGDPTSYPDKALTLGNKAIPEKDLLVSSPKAYRTSDVAGVFWWVGQGESRSQSVSTTTGIGVRGGITAGPVSAELSLARSTTDSYSIQMGKDAMFGGSVPPIRNDVNTPEDESQLYGYGFSPIVYRERYKTKDGNEGGFYVVTYSVNR